MLYAFVQPYPYKPFQNPYVFQPYRTYPPCRNSQVTAWDSENVVVLMTGETLKRMWCAAEIASAWAAQTNIVLVSCDGHLTETTWRKKNRS